MILVTFLHNPFSGSVYHLLDLLCYLHDRTDGDIRLYMMTGNIDANSVEILNKMTSNRYNNLPIKFITFQECLQITKNVKFSLLSTKTEILDFFNLNDIKSFLYFEHLGSVREPDQINVKTKLAVLKLKMSNRFCTLYNDKLLNPLNVKEKRPPSFGFPTIIFKHGIYDKYHIRDFSHLKRVNSLFYHDGLHSFFNNEYSSIKPLCKYERKRQAKSFEDIFKESRKMRFLKTKNFLHQNKEIEIINTYLDHPAYQTSGLLYDRVYDYCPRTVNEFLYYKKEFLLLSCTTGFYYFQDMIKKDLIIGDDVMIHITHDDIKGYKELFVDDSIMKIL